MKTCFRNLVVFFGLQMITISFVAEVYSQRNLDVCRVTTDTWSISGGYGTGIFEVGKFSVDDIEEGYRKSFQYETDNRVFLVDVEVEYGDSKDVQKGKPARLMLSMLARRAEDEKDKTIRPVEAWTTYGHKWGTVSVSSHVVSGDVAQHFALTCSDGISRNGVRRGEPKWLEKLKDKKDD